jgi:SAM-dependent methyltransferase
MCGSGRFLLPLLRAGVDIEGIDAAPAMLDACQRRALLEGLSPVLYRQVLEELLLPRKYRMAFVPSGSIGLLADTALPSALRKIKRHLEPGAVLLLEVVCFMDSDGVAGNSEPRVVQIDSETTITYTCRWSLTTDGASIEYDGTYEKRRNDVIVETETETLSLGLHQTTRFIELLVGCGFRRVNVLANSEYASLGSSGCVLIESHN